MSLPISPARRPPPNLPGPHLPRRAGAHGPAAWIAAARDLAERDLAGRANPHSRRVALLKRLLPAIGVGLLLLIAIWPRLAPLWERMRIALPSIDLRDARELRMINPRYAGIDRLGRPFVVTAAVGRQVPDRQDLMSLQQPHADMILHGGTVVVATAATGVYQSQTQLLDLFGNVTLVHQNGTRFVTAAARVDAAHNSASGSDPVAGHGPSGDIKAEGFRVFDNGDTILFTGRSELSLNEAASGTRPSVPPRLPAAVAASARRSAAEAAPILAAAKPQPAVAHRAAPPRRAAPGRARHAGRGAPPPARHAAVRKG